MDASSCCLGAAKHSSVMSKVLVSSYISEGDLGSRFDERTGLSKTQHRQVLQAVWTLPAD
jgi:hypothetical protein